MNKGWALAGERTAGEETRRKGLVNPDLWERLLDLMEVHDTEFRWVKGHAGNKGNERADALAVAASNSDDLAIDEGYETPSAHALI